MTIVLSTPPYQAFYDSDGDPLSGGLIYTYEAGTDTPKATFTTQAGTVEQTNPIVLDSAGRAVWWIEGSYKYVVKDSLGNTIKTVDNVTSFSVSSEDSTQILQSGLINGGFQVWMRNSTFGPLGSGLSYTADRWFVSRGASNAVVNRVAGPTASQYAARVQRNAADVDTTAIIFGQALESSNSYKYADSKVTLRFKARAGANYSTTNSILYVAVPTGTGSNQSASSGIGGGWTGYINTAMSPSNVTLTTSWQTFTLTSTAALPSTITQIMAFFQMQPTGTAGAADYFEVAEVELIVGDTAPSSFQWLDFETVRMQCRRHCRKSFAYATAPAQAAGNTGALRYFLPTGASGTFGVNVDIDGMMTAPTVTTYNTVSANADWRDVTNSADRTVGVTSSETGIVINGAAGVAGANNQIHYLAESEL